MPSNIPDRWLNYKPCGLVIEGTRIICFKVPLKSTIGRPPFVTWNVRSLLAEIPDLAAVIDLTNTGRYYNSKDLVLAGVEHKKILMRGRVIPPEKTVSEFITAVDKFLAKDDCSLVGVHCTHGLNRTGYMVCRYMRDRLGIPIREAIKRTEGVNLDGDSRKLVFRSPRGRKIAVDDVVAIHIFHRLHCVKKDLNLRVVTGWKDKI